jgi:hypothetical protein
METGTGTATARRRASLTAQPTRRVTVQTPTTQTPMTQKPTAQAVTRTTVTRMTVAGMAMLRPEPPPARQAAQRG